MSLSIKKIYTDNPFVDMLLFYVKLLSYGSIIKDENAANAGEQLDSLKSAELYIYAIENGAEFTMYSYNQTMLEAVLTPADMVNIDTYVKTNSSIPEKYHDALVKIARQNVIDTYEEKNNYYRKICGLPNYGDKGIPFAPYSYLLPVGEKVDIAYVHEIGANGAKMLEANGIIDVIKLDYPTAEYLDYMSAGISIYKARKMVDKQILYMPSCGNTDIDDLFSEKYEIVRDYVMRCIDSTAMEYGSENYQGFLSCFIFFLTILDIITDVQDHIIRKDILDARCIEYIFDMYGVPYFKNIPIRYQITLCKNINTIVQYKSSPTDMLKFISYFGANSVKIYKYYLLRDRNTDMWGEYVFNEVENITSIYNEGKVIHTTANSDAGNLTIPFPFDFYLNKGNKMYLWIDNMKLIENVDYTVYNYNLLKFTDPANNSKPIRYEFYYDADTVNSDFIANTKDSVETDMQTIPANPNLKSSIQLNLPYTDYLLDGNEIMLVIAGSIVSPDAYTIDKSTNILTIVRSYTFTNREISVIYFHGNSIANKVQVNKVLATSNNQTTFKVPEPFESYVMNGNKYFVTIGSTFIDPSRYTFNMTDKTITFTDGTVIGAGRHVSFTFIYSVTSIYSKIDIVTETQVLGADSYYQYMFTLDSRFSTYMEAGYKLYVYLRGWYLDSSFFDAYGNNITLRDRTIALMPGETMTVYCMHGPLKENCTTSSEMIGATTLRQPTFTIHYPMDHFFERGDDLIVDVAGYPLSKSQYTISGDQLTITDVDHLPYTNERVGIQYIYNGESNQFTNIYQQELIASDNNQTKFYLNLPFYPYFETLHGILVFHNSLLVSSSHITVSKYLMYLDIDIAKGDQIMILYIFNNKYLTEKTTRLIVEEKTTSNILDDLTLPIPVPFDDYLEHNWPFFVDNEKKWLDTTNLDFVNNGLSFPSPIDIKNYKSFTFTFIYKKEGCLTITTTEDYSQDIDLTFLKLPLDAFTDTDKYVKMKDQVKGYDPMTRSDYFWDGADPKTEEFGLMHAAIKKAIISKQFNYARTKYMSVNSIKDVAEMSFQIPYFYNMLFDDVFKEDLLTIQIPNISSYHDFKISHVFCYMTALAYIFNGIDDKLMENPTKVLLVKGFNFNASLADLKQWILDQRRLPSDYDAFSFMITSDQYHDINEFVKTYRVNKAIYQTITTGMAEANNYDIYCIWKKLYDSLMVWQFNMEFFKLNNGNVASTFTEFLSEKEPLLYASLTKIRDISDDDIRQGEIISMIEDIVYILNAYIDSNEFKYIYESFPGVSQDYLLEYLFTIINFFKSYKVMIHSMSTDLYFNSPTNNLIRPHDVQTMEVHLDKLDYITLNDTKETKVKTTLVDKIGIREKISFKVRYDT